MLSFELNDDGYAIQIYIDNAGIEKLIAALNRIKAGDCHMHLRSRSMNGNDLDDINPWGAKAFDEVIFTDVSDGE